VGFEVVQLRHDRQFKGCDYQLQVFSFKNHAIIAAILVRLEI
jgi:hypothetical protein